MKNVIFVLLAASVFSISAKELVRNGSFEAEAGGFAADWNASRTYLSEGMVTLDRQKAAIGKNSLRMTKFSGKGTVSCIQNIALKSKAGNRKLAIRLKACAVKAKDGQLIIITRNADQKRLQWIPVFKFNGSFDFQEFHKTIDLHPDTVSLVVSCRAPHPGGILWADAVSLQLIESGAAELNFEGKKSSVTGLPEPWREKKFHGNENVSAVSFIKENGRTVAVQKYTTGGPLSGFSAPLPAGLVRQKYIALACPFRTDADGTVKIGIEFFDAGGNAIGELLSRNQNSGEWKIFSGNFTVPAKAVSASVLLLNTGRSEVRFGAVSAAPGSADNAISLSEPAIRTRVFPVAHSMNQLNVPFPEFNTFTNSPTKLTFHFTGDKKRMKKPTLCIDLPAEVKIADAVCPHPSYFRQEKFTVSPISRPEGKYRRWKFVSASGMKLAGKKSLYQRRLVVLIMPEKTGTVFNGKKVFYHLENDGAMVQNGSFNLNLLAAMPETPNPKRFLFMRWNDEDITWRDPAAFIASLRCQEEANYIWASRYPNPELQDSRRIMASRGWKFFIRGAPNLALRHYTGVKTMKIEKAVQANGKSRNTVCPSFLTFDEAFAPIRDRLIGKYITDRFPKPGEYLMSDNEPWHPMDWCFCLRCRTLFAKLNQLDPVPDAAEIRSKYGAQWRDFRLEQERRLIAAVHEQAKKHRLVYGDYNYIIDYSKPNWKQRFFSVAKDARLNEADQDFHLPSYYHCLDAAGFDMMTVGTKYLKKPYIPIFAIDGAGSYLSLAEVLDPARFRMQLLTAAVTGCSGAAVYPGERMDGKFYIAADQAMKEIAALEDFFLDGTPVNDIEAKALPFNTTRIKTESGEQIMEWPLWKKEFRSNIRQLGKRKLLSLLNYHPEQTAYVRVRLSGPEKERICAEYICGQKITIPSGEKEFIIAVPPRDARMVVFGAVPPADFTPTPDQETIRAAFEQDKLRFNTKSGSVAAWKDRDFEFTYSDINGDGVPEAVIRSRKLALTIEPASGRIVQIETAGIKLFGKGKRTGFIAEPRLWLPSAFRRNMGFKKSAFVSVRRQDNKMIAEQLMTDNPMNLELRRTYTLTQDSDTVEVKTAYRNTGKVPLNLMPWSRSVLSTSEPSGNSELFGMIKGTEQNLPIVRGCTKGALPISGKVADIPRSTNNVFPLDSPVVRQLFPSDGLQLCYRPDPASAAAFFFDSSIGTTTVERLDSSLDLAPGESRTTVEDYEFRQLQKNKSSWENGK